VFPYANARQNHITEKILRNVANVKYQGTMHMGQYCEQGKEPLDFIKGGEPVDQLSRH
jgi:hypothetical protein